MQDFTKTLGQPIAETKPVISTSVPTDNALQPNNGFIESRMNKDNFWNLMFAVLAFLGAITSWLVATQFGDHPVLGGLVAWSTILGVPFTLRKFNKTTFTKNETNDKGRFFNSEGEDITDRMPTNLLWPIIVTFALSIISGSVALIIFAPALYFIILNCPISILFNLNFWQGKHVTNTDANNSFVPPKRDPFSSITRTIRTDNYVNRSTSPSYSSLTTNIWHRR